MGDAAAARASLLRDRGAPRGKTLALALAKRGRCQFLESRPRGQAYGVADISKSWPFPAAASELMSVSIRRILSGHNVIRIVHLMTHELLNVAPRFQDLDVIGGNLCHIISRIHRRGETAGSMS